MKMVLGKNPKWSYVYLQCYMYFYSTINYLLLHYYKISDDIINLHRLIKVKQTSNGLSIWKRNWTNFRTHPKVVDSFKDQILQTACYSLS